MDVVNVPNSAVFSRSRPVPTCRARATIRPVLLSCGCRGCVNVTRSHIRGTQWRRAERSVDNARFEAFRISID